MNFNKLTRILNIVNSKNKLKEFTLITFKKSNYSNFSKFDYIKNMETIFDNNLAPNKWYTQFYMGCILFSLVNSGILNNVLIGLEYNRDRQLKYDLSDIEHIKYELKVIDIWKELTGYNVLEDNIRKDIEEKLEHINSFNDLVQIMQLLKRNEKHFYNNEIKSIKQLCNTKNIILNANDSANQKIEYIKHLPVNSLICHNEHWFVFLGIKNNKIIACNPILNDRFDELNINLAPFFEMVIIKEK